MISKGFEKDARSSVPAETLTTEEADYYSDSMEEADYYSDSVGEADCYSDSTPEFVSNSDSAEEFISNTDSTPEAVSTSNASGYEHIIERICNLPVEQFFSVVLLKLNTMDKVETNELNLVTEIMMKTQLILDEMTPPAVDAYLKQKLSQNYEITMVNPPGSH